MSDKNTTAAPAHTHNDTISGLISAAATILLSISALASTGCIADGFDEDPTSAEFTIGSFSAPTHWTIDDYGDAQGWKSDPSYWFTIHYADLNGDGRSDVCGRTPSGLVCALSNGSSFGVRKLWTTGDYGDAQGWKSDLSYWQTITFMDLNGDGKSDVCGRRSVGLYCALSTGSSFGTPKYWVFSYSNNVGWNSSPSYWATIRYVDLNGDGKSDVCGRATDGLYCALSNGSSFGSPKYWTTGDYGDAQGWKSDESYWRTIRYADLNGDGKSDVCGRAPDGLVCALSNGSSFGAPTLWTIIDDYGDAQGWNSDESYWRTIRYTDLNGDGKSDVCGRAFDGLFCALSNGSSFGVATFWTTVDYSNAQGWNSDESYWSNIQYSDLNGDGKSDVCGRAMDGLYCALSNGSSFGAATFWTTVDYGDAQAWKSDESYWRTIRYADLNGDGKRDVCGRAVAGLYCALSN